MDAVEEIINFCLWWEMYPDSFISHYMLYSPEFVLNSELIIIQVYITLTKHCIQYFNYSIHNLKRLQLF